MLKTILTISGKPGLFRLISQGKNSIVVESLITGRRGPAYASDRVISLGDISIYTTEADVPLPQILQTIQERQGGAKLDETAITATGNSLSTFFAEILPDYDQARVYPTDIKKIVKWYNLLIDQELTDFTSQGASQEQESLGTTEEIEATN